MNQLDPRLQFCVKKRNAQLGLSYHYWHLSSRNQIYKSINFPETVLMAIRITSYAIWMRLNN